MIAVTSPNGRTVSGHAGKCPGFLMFSPLEAGEALTHVKLARDQVLHQVPRLSEAEDHPLQGITVLITNGCGDGMIRKMQRDGIEVVLTDQSDPVAAVAAYLTAKAVN